MSVDILVWSRNGLGYRSQWRDWWSQLQLASSVSPLWGMALFTQNISGGYFSSHWWFPSQKNIVISNKLLNKLSTCRWFETLIWRHCNAIALCYRSYLRCNWRALRLSYCYDVGRSVPGHCSVVVIVRTKYLDCHPCVRSSVRLDCVIWLPKFPVILPKFYRCSTNCVLRVPYNL